MTLKWLSNRRHNGQYSFNAAWTIRQSSICALFPNDDGHVTTLCPHQFLLAVGDRSTLEFHFEPQQDDPNPSPIKCWLAAIHPEWVWSQ